MAHSDSYGAVVHADNPVAWYRLDNDGVADEMGGSSGTRGGATWVASLLAGHPDGQALSYDGSDRTDVPNQAKLKLTSGFSVEAWVSASDLSATYGAIVSKNLYGLEFYNSGSNPIIDFYVYSGGSFKSAASSTVSENTLYHVVGVHTGSALKLYLNGSLVDTTSGVGSAATGNDSLSFGAWSDSNFDYLTGTVDEVAIYDRVLTAAEVQEHYDAGITAPAAGEDRLRIGDDAPAAIYVGDSAVDAVYLGDTKVWP